MNRVRAFFQFLYDFVVGDDITIAIVVVVALGVTALLSTWWVLPLAVLAILSVSVLRGARPQ
jgi:hypothetical protein